MDHIFVYSEDGKLLHKSPDQGDYMAYHMRGTTVRVRRYEDRGDHYEVSDKRIKRIEGGGFGALQALPQHIYIFILPKSELRELVSEPELSELCV